MKTLKYLKSCQYEIQEHDEQMTIHIEDRMDSANTANMIRVFTSLITKHLPKSLIINMEKVTYLDDFGMLVLLELRELMAGADGRFQLINIPNKVNEILSIHNFEALGERVSFAGRPPPGMFVRLGEGTIRHYLHLEELMVFIGSVCLALFNVCFHPKSLRGNDIITNMQKTGVDALPIVGLISFLLGLIMAFMSSVQLQQFGANIYVASLVSLAMTRELGPIMTAIIVAGRSGSAYATEIGTMKISEEVDALFTMGFETTNFLVVPKVIAAIIVVPLLTLFSDVFAILGGLIVGVFMLDLTTNAYMVQTINTLTLFDVFFGFFKGGVFALLISCISCFRGFQVKGGAASVGEATTRAVVSSIFLIILSNSVFSVIIRYWG